MSGLGGAPAVLPRVRLIATGGTIAGTGASSTSLTDYAPGTLSGAALLADLPMLEGRLTVEAEQLANLNSADLGFDLWRALAQRIEALFRADPELAGIVVSHGTNTLEETAYLLQLTVRHHRPVVLVGALRPATALSADGPLNLLQALLVAAAPEAGGHGVLVVMNGQIHGARDVTKGHTLQLEAFRSPEGGPLGQVVGEQVRLERRPARRHTTASEFEPADLERLPWVEILYGAVQPSPLLIETLVAAGVDGLVFAGTGAGLISCFEKEALQRALAQRPGAPPVLVRSNRTGSGPVPATAEYDALAMIPAGNLNPQKARVLLLLALARGLDGAGIRRVFEQY
jgi:L-asparaginase